MADSIITKQELIDAQKDAQTLEEVISGEPGKLVETRLGRKVYTLASVPQINTMTREEIDTAVAPKANKVDVDAALAAYVGGRKAYTTLALAQAAQSSLPANTAIEVTNDGANNGTYQWNGATLTKSAYDPLTQAKNHTEQSLPISKTLFDLFSPTNTYETWNIEKSLRKLRNATNVAVNVFPIEAGKTYFIKSTDFREDYVYLGASPTSNLTVDKVLTPITLISTELPDVKTFSVPANSVNKFAFINVKWGTVSLDITNTTAISDRPIESVVKKAMGAPIRDDLAQKRLDAIPVADLLTKSSLQLLNDNLYNPANLIPNLYVDSTNGTMASFTGGKITRFDVTPNTTYYIRSPKFLPNALVGLKADTVASNGQLTTKVALTPISDGVMSFTTPSDSSLLHAFFTVELSTQDYYVTNTLAIEDNTHASLVGAAGYPILVDPELKQDVESLKDQVSAINVVSPLFGLKWAVIGDSITEVNFRTNKNYHAYISDYVGGMTIYNYGISATAWTGRALVPASIKGQVTNGQIQEPDLFTVFLGTNDFGVGAKPLGVFGDMTTDTVAGGIYALLNNLITEFPTKKIAVFTPLPRYNSYGLTGGAPNQYGVTLLQICEMIKKHCNHFGIPCLDLYFESNLYVFNADANQYYFTAPSYSNPDGVHPNDLGHQVIAKKIQKFLESI
ncbi:SGNH/GDSL hydrolase family protein [Acinetobacter johnsonii]|uniref:SGNH/GDSL hydrolase family protein n=1 Tax=Acinetobacter johnsonii TaxID=40214 RepID=UPI001330D65E|nr:SGNH/GDSL hydrolase family protein [Acinetobacter johnsonii]